MKNKTRLIILSSAASLLSLSSQAQSGVLPIHSNHQEYVAEKTEEDLEEEYRLQQSGRMAVYNDVLTDAENGNIQKQFTIGSWYDTNNQNEKQFLDAIALDKNDEIAAEWYRKSADNGHTIAQERLCAMYNEGRGVKKDKMLAIHYCGAAEGNGSKFASDLKNSIIISDLEEKVKSGDSNAQNDMGYMYEYGKGLEKNINEAIAWYKKSAEQGNSVALTNLGKLYDNGKEVNQDFAEAANWYEKAAKQGNRYAQERLGYFFKEGKGVAQDENMAAEWYLKAAKQGSEQADLEYRRIISYQKYKSFVSSINNTFGTPKGSENICVAGVRAGERNFVYVPEYVALLSEETDVERISFEMPGWFSKNYKIISHRRADRRGVWKSISLREVYVDRISGMIYENQTKDSTLVKCIIPTQVDIISSETKNIKSDTEGMMLSIMLVDGRYSKLLAKSKI